MNNMLFQKDFDPTSKDPRELTDQEREVWEVITRENASTIMSKFRSKPKLALAIGLELARMAREVVAHEDERRHGTR